MMDAKLGREVLDVADFESEHFEMRTWGTVTRGCGVVACLAGTTLLCSGYTMNDDGIFWRPDGSFVENVPQEAQDLLGLSVADTLEGNTLPWLWMDFDHGLERFRAIVEKAEKESLGVDNRRQV